MARSPNIPTATRTIIRELAKAGVHVTARQLEDWVRHGLIPRPHRQSLGRGRGTRTIYPPDMAEKCIQVASLMRRGRPWQYVALVLFAQGNDIPDTKIHNAYRWACYVEAPQDTDELSIAETAVLKIAETRAGKQLLKSLAFNVKNSGQFRDESPEAIAKSVLTNMLLVPYGGAFVTNDALKEYLIGIGLPLSKLSDDEQDDVSRFMNTFFELCEFETIANSISNIPIDELRKGINCAKEAVELCPADFRKVIFSKINEQFLLAILAPYLVRIRQVANQSDLID
jgi:hypothetical protein